MGFAAPLAHRLEPEDSPVHFHRTPPALAERMVEMLLELVPDSSITRLLDPGIGDGALSAAAVAGFKRRGKQLEIVGTDVSTSLLRDASQALADVPHSLLREDFLTSEVGSFDAAICNPPYGKRSVEELGEALVQEYRDAISGHPNLFALFIHKIVRSLRPQGVAVVICPRSVLSGAYFGGIRRFLAAQGSVERILLFDQRERIFDEVLQGVCVLAFRSGVQQGPCSVERVRPSGDEDQWELPTAIGGPEINYRIIPGSSRQNRDLVERALAYPHRIEDVFHVETGPLVWFRAKDKVMATETNAPDALPVIWSDQIHDGFIGKERRSNRVRAVTRGDFSLKHSKVGPAVVTKRVTAPEEARRLVAALVPQRLWREPVIYENHTNVLRPRDQEPVAAVKLATLLSTEVYEELIRSVCESTQVGAAELRMMPWLEPALTDIELNDVRAAAENGRTLLELPVVSRLAGRLLEKLTTAELGDPDIGSRRDVVDLTLPLTETNGVSVDGGKSVDL